MRRGLAAGRKSLEPRAVHEEDVEPAVVVVVVECDSTSGRLQQIFVFVLAAEDSLHIQSGLACHIQEADANIAGSRLFGGLRFLLCSQPSRARKFEYTLER